MVGLAQLKARRMLCRSLKPQGTNAYDEDEQISRMYLEFGNGGDMKGWQDSLADDDGNSLQPPEEHLWRILGCLAKALHLLEFGSEDPSVPDPNWSEYRQSRTINRFWVVLGTLFFIRGNC